MANTTNFGWETPDDTDLVKDGAAAMRTLGSAIDTSFVDLKGGTTGQNLRKATNTDLDFTWAGDATNTVIDAEGDLLVGDSADTLQRLAIGTTGQVLTVDTTLDGKIKWAAASTGALTLLSRTTFSNVATQDFTGVFSSTYNAYIAVIEDFYTATANNAFLLQLRTSGGVTNTGYYGNTYRLDYNDTAFTFQATNNASALTLFPKSGTSTYPGHGFINFFRVGTDNVYPAIFGQYYDNELATLQTGFGYVANSVYTGFRLSSTTNISGTVILWGVNKS